MKQCISYTNYSGDSSKIGKSGYIPFPKDLNPIFAKSNENVNKIFDRKTEKGNIIVTTESNKKNKIRIVSKSKKK